MTKHGRSKAKSSGRTWVDPRFSGGSVLHVANITPSKSKTVQMQSKEAEKEKEIKYANVSEYVGGKVILSLTAQKIIKYLTGKYSTKEWSGIIVWDIISGSLANVKELVLNVEYLELMDIGTAGATNYNNEEDSDSFLDLYDNYPDAITKRVAHCHSHHSMQACFSPTDTEELHNNADKYVAYLSVIVNNKMECVAKLAVVSTEKILRTVKDFDDTIKTREAEDKRLLLYTMQVELEEEEIKDTLIQSIEKKISKITEFAKSKITISPLAISNGLPMEHYTGGIRPTEDRDAIEKSLAYQRVLADPDRCTCYFYFPTDFINNLIANILDLKTYNSFSRDTIIVATDDKKQNPLDYSNIDDVIESEVSGEVESLYIADEPILTSNFDANFLFVYLTYDRVLKEVKEFPDGQTKQLFTESLNRLLTTFTPVV